MLQKYCDVYRAGLVALLQKVLSVLLCALDAVGSQRVTRVELAEFTRLMQFLCGGGPNTGKMVPACRLYRKQVPHKDNGSFSYSPHPEVSQLSLFLYVWHLSSYCSSEDPKVSA